tara:strand:- start:315 stop:650 length:336 start_codon:yes stop_codon:yes gene_type:complete
MGAKNSKQICIKCYHKCSTGFTLQDISRKEKEMGDIAKEFTGINLNNSLDSNYHTMVFLFEDEKMLKQFKKAVQDIDYENIGLNTLKTTFSRPYYQTFSRRRFSREITQHI